MTNEDTGNGIRSGTLLCKSRSTSRSSGKGKKVLKGCRPLSSQDVFRSALMASVDSEVMVDLSEVVNALKAELVLLKKDMGIVMEENKRLKLLWRDCVVISAVVQMAVIRMTVFR